MSPCCGDVNVERGEGPAIDGDDWGRTWGEATRTGGGGGEAARGNEVSQEVSESFFVNLWNIEGFHWSSPDQLIGSVTA